MTIQNTDLLVVQRGDTAYKIDFENLKDNVIEDTHRVTITVSRGTQTVFDVSPTEIQDGSELVYLNGTLLVSGSDYDVTDTSEVTLATAAVLGDIFELISDSSVTGQLQNQNLGYRTASNHGVVTITSGANAIIPDADSVNAGLMGANDWRKLDGIEAGAEVNVQANWTSTNSSADEFIKNKPIIGDGRLRLRDHEGTTLADFTANQTGNTTVDLPQGFSGDYDDLDNAPVIGDGRLRLRDHEGTTLADFTANQTGNVTVDLPQGFSGDYDDLINTPNSVERKTITVITDTQSVFDTSPVGIESGSELVYLNGTLLIPGSDYDVTGDSEITLDTDAVLGDIFELFSTNEVTGERQNQNLGYRNRTDSGVVTITDGDNAVIPSANNSRAGLMTVANWNKLDSIEASAEVNVQSDWNAPSSSDAHILNKPDTVVESITAGAGVTVSNGGIGDVTITCTVDQLEFGGSADVTSSTVPSTTFNAVPLAIADFYVNVGFGKFSAQWAAVTDNATTATDADPGDYLVYNGSTFEHIPSGTPPAADPNWIAAGGKLEPVNKNNQVVIGNSATALSLDVVGRVRSTGTKASDGDFVLTTKGYVRSLIPTVGNGTLTINLPDGTSPTFTANQSTDTSIDIPEPFSGDYDDLTDKPTIGNGQLFIKDFDGTGRGRFFANQTGDTVITLPDLSYFLTAVTVDAPITVDTTNANEPKIGINLTTISNIDDI